MNKSVDEVLSFPDFEPNDIGKTVQYCCLSYEYLDETPKEGEIFDLTPSSSDKEMGGWVVLLTFFTSEGEERRYIDNSQSDLADDAMSKVLAALGEKGWEAISVIDDGDENTTWYLQRVILT